MHFENISFYKRYIGLSKVELQSLFDDFNPFSFTNERKQEQYVSIFEKDQTYLSSGWMSAWNL